MEEVLKLYQLLATVPQFTKFIGPRTQILTVLKAAHPHLIRIFGRRPIHLSVDKKTDRVLVQLNVAYPPATMTQFRREFETAYYSSVPADIKARIDIDKRR